MSWTLFEYSVGNPYIAFTEAEKRRILRKYRRAGIRVTERKAGFYFVHNLEIKN